MSRARRQTGLTAGLVIAGTASGVGKSTIALGLMGALKGLGLVVAPFKSGPDYIDPGLHRRVTGRPSRNLDTWMMSPEAVRETFTRGCAGADVALVEGAMGLFDGVSGGDAGSTAHLAKSLGLPVVLVVDAARMAGSVAALVHGFATLDPELHLAGVILNRVASPGHLEHLHSALAARTNAPVLGHLMREEKLALPERHLGLVTADDLADGAALDHMAARVGRGVNLEALLRAASGVPAETVTAATAPPRVRLAVARDEAFCFVYPHNLEQLEAAGAQIVPFSPLRDGSLPDGVDGIYFPGGYPELHASTLSENTAMRGAVRDASERGIPIFAECGGLIYLSRGIHTLEGDFASMCGVLPADCRMRPRRVALGYRQVRVEQPGLLGTAGTQLRGHEFRYSEVDEAALDRAGVARTLTLSRPGGTEARTEGFRIGRTWATYAHVVLTPEAARCWVAALGEMG